MGGEIKWNNFVHTLTFDMKLLSPETCSEFWLSQNSVRAWTSTSERQVSPLGSSWIACWKLRPPGPVEWEVAPLRALPGGDAPLSEPAGLIPRCWEWCRPRLEPPCCVGLRCCLFCRW